MANQVTLTFAGDSKSLAKESKAAQDALAGVGKAAGDTAGEMAKNAKGAVDLGTRMGHLGSTVSGAADALDAIGGSLQAVVDLQKAGAERASRLAHATLDVQQAQEDYNQALRDGKQAELDVAQAGIDLEQANLDAAAALVDYNTAVKEHGKNSLEARQAQIDLKQAQQDAKQANEDAAQATRDAAQATIDAKGAQLDLNDAQREANPPKLEGWAEKLQLVTPLLSALAGIVGLVTAAQWAWNAAQLASPTTWIILAIVALIAVIVLIATKTKWFQTAWRVAWDWIKKAASNTWDFIKKIPDWIGTAFKKIVNFITAPFKAAFNLVADIWNNTIGRLHFKLPDWIPGIGGNSISVPQIPKFHRGGEVPGIPGTEMLAVLEAGEKIIPRGGSGSAPAGGGRQVKVIIVGGDRDAIAYFRRLHEQGAF